jgi:hypothetical protein
MIANKIQGKFEFAFLTGAGVGIVVCLVSGTSLVALARISRSYTYWAFAAFLVMNLAVSAIRSRIAAQIAIADKPRAHTIIRVLACAGILLSLGIGAFLGAALCVMLQMLLGK